MSQHSDDEFSRFVRQVRPALRRSAFLLSGDWHEADDLVQRTLIAIYRRWDTLDRRTALDAYARKVMVRLLVSDRRAARWSREFLHSPLPEPDPAPDESALLGERFVLLAALANLSVRQRTVVYLRFWEDLSVEDVARKLGCSSATVRSQASRALVSLRSMLRAHFPELAARAVGGPLRSSLRVGRRRALALGAGNGAGAGGSTEYAVVARASPAPGELIAEAELIVQGRQ